MSTTSFRARVLIGFTLVIAGVLGLAHLLSIFVIHRFPITLRIGHDAMAVIALVCVGIGLTQVRRGLSPFGQLRSRLAALREGRESRIEGSYPSEVQPLVNDLNALLDHREERMRRALSRAGDLAHGLKTPLAVLAREADRAEAAGEHDLAEAIDEQVGRMRRQIDYHLAHARASGSGGSTGIRSSILTSVEGLTRTMEHLHSERQLTFDVVVAPDHETSVQHEDLDEILGNLLDNACRFSRSKVKIESAKSDREVIVMVDDDGPGLVPAMREAVLQRGVRADEAAPGSGLGLAIVRDLAELYGGSIVIEDAPIGGLRARLTLPTA